MTPDNITVPRELLRQFLDEAVVTSSMTKAYSALRTALEQPAVEPDNLKCKSVQKRLATLWGYVEAQQPVQEPVMDRESSWYALVMCAAAEIEDASNCLRDPDAKRTAIRGAEYYRNAAKAMSAAQQPPRVGSGVTVEQALEQWEHDFHNPMTTEQQADWVKREREFASAQAQHPAKEKS